MAKGCTNYEKALVADYRRGKPAGVNKAWWEQHTAKPARALIKAGKCSKLATTKKNPLGRCKIGVEWRHPDTGEWSSREFTFSQRGYFAAIKVGRSKGKANRATRVDLVCSPRKGASLRRGSKAKHGQIVLAYCRDGKCTASTKWTDQKDRVFELAGGKRR